MSIETAIAAQIIQATSSTGAKPIPAVVDAHAAAVRISNEARNIAAPPDVAYAAIAAALRRGEDPAADPEVQRIITAQQIGNEGVGRGVEGIVFGLFREAAHEHAEALVQSWQAPFNKAAGALAGAHQVIGNLPLDDAASIMLKGGSVAKVWGEARDAEAVIGRIVLGWSALGDFTHLAPRDQRWNVLRLAVVDLDTLGELGSDARKLTAWQAILRGLTLSLPTFTEYHGRVRFVEQGAAQAQAQAQENHRALMTNQRPKQVGPIIPGHVLAGRVL